MQSIQIELDRRPTEQVFDRHGARMDGDLLGEQLLVAGQGP